MRSLNWITEAQGEYVGSIWADDLPKVEDIAEADYFLFDDGRAYIYSTGKYPAEYIYHLIANRNVEVE